MIRIVCCENEHTVAMHVGGPANIEYKTFDVELPDVERWLDELHGIAGRQYNMRCIVGFERIYPMPGEPIA